MGQINYYSLQCIIYDIIVFQTLYPLDSKSPPPLPDTHTISAANVQTGLERAYFEYAHNALHVCDNGYGNGVRAVSNVVLPPSTPPGPPGRRADALRASAFGIFPGARLGNHRNTSTVPMMLYVVSTPTYNVQ